MSESSTLFVATVSYDVMPRPQGALSNGVIRLSVCLSVGSMPLAQTVHFRAMVTVEH